jgi:hypothetical protein
MENQGGRWEGVRGPYWWDSSTEAHVQAVTTGRLGEEHAKGKLHTGDIDLHHVTFTQSTVCEVMCACTRGSGSQGGTLWRENGLKTSLNGQ